MPPSSAEADALEQLQRILARPEFQTDQSRSWWEQLQTAISDMLFNLFVLLAQTVGDAAGGREGWVGLVALAVGAISVLAVLVYLVRAIRLAVVREARLKAESLAQRRERSDRLWDTAQQLAAAGDWPAAVRAAYLSALYALDEHALLHVQSGLTNREHATGLAQAHPELDDGTFAELVMRYDRLRYGRFPITAAAYEDLSHLVVRARSMSAA
jgi:uncharacterized membrane protein YcjF (UPF0283 family)